MITNREGDKGDGGVDNAKRGGKRYVAECNTRVTSGNTINVYSLLVN